jgi:hypothetical protein
MMTKTTTRMMKAQARVLNAMRVIRPAQNAIDAFPPEPGAIGASQRAQNATGATRPAQNVVDAIVPEANTSVAERELAPDSDAVVAPLRSSCLHHAPSYPDCVQTFWAESVAPTTSIALVTAVGNSQAPNHIRALQAAMNDTAYPDYKLMPAVLENSRKGDSSPSPHRMGRGLG